MRQTVQEQHEPLVEGGEDKPTREESNEEHDWLSVKLRETNVEPSGDDKHVQEDHEELTVEPRENEDAVDDGNMDVEVDPEEVKVEFEEKKTFQDVKDEEKCSIGEEETNKGERSFAFNFSHEETRHSMEERKGRESQGARENKPMSGDLEKKNVPKIVREAVSRFKQKDE